MNNSITNDETTLKRAFSSLWEKVIETLDQSLIDRFDIHLRISKQHTENWDRTSWSKATWSDKAPDWDNWEKSDTWPS